MTEVKKEISQNLQRFNIEKNNKDEIKAGTHLEDVLLAMSKDLQQYANTQELKSFREVFCTLLYKAMNVKEG